MPPWTLSIGGQGERHGEAEEIEIGVVVAAMAVLEDAEGEAAPGLGMDCAIEEGPAVELLADDVRLGAGLGAGECPSNMTGNG